MFTIPHRSNNHIVYYTVCALYTVYAPFCSLVHCLYTRADIPNEQRTHGLVTFSVFIVCVSLL